MIDIFLAEGFEEVEALTPCDMLRRAGLDVRLIGVDGRQVVGAHGIRVLCDISDSEAHVEQQQMLVLPGGVPGTPNLEKSPTVQRFIDTAAKNGAFIAAICAAPSILGHKGLLEGKRATCYPGYEDSLQGALYTGEAVERDGNFITARGMGVSLEFALCLVEALCGAEKAAQLKAAVQS